MSSQEIQTRNVKKNDVAAWMRDGVNGLMLVGGLPQAVARLSTCSARSLRTRTGIEGALAEIRRHFPAPDDLRLYLKISTSTPPEAVQVLQQVRAVLERDLEVGILRECWHARGSRMLTLPSHEISGSEGVPADAREAWDIFTSVAVTCRIQPRSIETPRSLGLAAVRALQKLKGRQKQAVAVVAALPRACALDADAAAVAFAHAPREGGSVAVVVVETTNASVWRNSARTGIRPVAPRPWHRDPAIDATMATCAKASIARYAPYQITAATGERWTQALLAQTEEGFEAFLQRPDGRIDHVEVGGRGTWASLGPKEAARLAATSGRPVEKQRVHWLPREEKSDADQSGPEAFLAALVAAGTVTQAQMRRFHFRVEGAIRRTKDAAVLAFLAGLPSATAELARLIYPITSYDAVTNRRRQLGRQNVDAAMMAATHSDPAAMVRAVKDPSTRALILTAALCGPWEVASEAIASGASPRKALLLYMSTAIDRPLPRAAATSLGQWPPSPWYGPLNADASLADFCDLSKLAAALWAETPSRPPMTTPQLVALMHALKQFGFVPPSAAGPDDRTWDDPGTTTAYANALRRERDEVVGSAPLGDGIADVIRFLDGKLVALGLARDAREAVRCICLVPPGRLVTGLKRVSGEWHLSVVRMTRERNVLVEDLISEEIRSWDETVLDELPEDYPNPVPCEIVHGGVVIRPLRTPREIDREGEEMANCVSTYRDEARIGDLLLYSLESPSGRSTLGLEVTHGARSCMVSIYQHYGPQHSRVDAPPPPEHADTASWLTSSLMRTDGGPCGPKWRVQLLASRRAHARSASSRPSEQSLSPARQRRLAELDLKHLGCLLGRNERRLDLDQFHRWAERLAVAFSSRTGSSTTSLDRS